MQLLGRDRADAAATPGVDGGSYHQRQLSHDLTFQSATRSRGRLSPRLSLRHTGAGTAGASWGSVGEEDSPLWSPGGTWRSPGSTHSWRRSSGPGEYGRSRTVTLGTRAGRGVGEEEEEEAEEEAGGRLGLPGRMPRSLTESALSRSSAAAAGGGGGAAAMASPSGSMSGSQSATPVSVPGGSDWRWVEGGSGRRRRSLSVTPPLTPPLPPTTPEAEEEEEEEGEDSGVGRVRDGLEGASLGSGGGGGGSGAPGGRFGLERAILTRVREERGRVEAMAQEVAAALENAAKAEERARTAERATSALPALLCDTALAELAVYGVCPAHAASTQKVHTPARRLLRAYRYAATWQQEAGGDHRVAATCLHALLTAVRQSGDDVTRLVYWWSNVVVLREAVQAMAASSASVSASAPAATYSSGAGRGGREEDEKEEEEAEEEEEQHSLPVSSVIAMPPMSADRQSWDDMSSDSEDSQGEGEEEEEEEGGGEEEEVSESKASHEGNGGCRAAAAGEEAKEEEGKSMGGEEEGKDCEDSGAGAEGKEEAEAEVMVGEADGGQAAVQLAVAPLQENDKTLRGGKEVEEGAGKGEAPSSTSSSSSHSSSPASSASSSPAPSLKRSQTEPGSTIQRRLAEEDRQKGKNNHSLPTSSSLPGQSQPAPQRDAMRRQATESTQMLRMMAGKKERKKKTKKEEGRQQQQQQGGFSFPEANPMVSEASSSNFTKSLLAVERYLHSKVLHCLWTQVFLPLLHKGEAGRGAEQAEEAAAAEEAGGGSRSGGGLWDGKAGAGKVMAMAMASLRAKSVWRKGEGGGASSHGVVKVKALNRVPSSVEDAASAAGQTAEQRWQSALTLAAARLCPMRAQGRVCGCALPLSKQVLDQCLGRMDTLLFNALIRSSPSDMAGEPITDFAALPFPPGQLRFSHGLQLKMGVSMWTDVALRFGATDGPAKVHPYSRPAANHSAATPRESAPSTLSSAGGSGSIWDMIGQYLPRQQSHSSANSVSSVADEARELPSSLPSSSHYTATPSKQEDYFPFLTAMADLLMLPKSMLADVSVRREVCGVLSLQLIRRIVYLFVPDGSESDYVSPSLLAAINAEVKLETAGQGWRNRGEELKAPPFPSVYRMPNSQQIKGLIEPSVFSFRNGAPCALDRGDDSDEELRVQESPMDFFLTETLSYGASNLEPAKEDQAVRARIVIKKKKQLRYQMLRDVWGSRSSQYL